MKKLLLGVALVSALYGCKVETEADVNSTQLQKWADQKCTDHGMVWDHINIPLYSSIATVRCYSAKTGDFMVEQLPVIRKQ